MIQTVEWSPEVNKSTEQTTFKQKCLNCIVQDNIKITFHILVRVPQGSILAPLLYSVYIVELPLYLDIYTDDSAILFPSNDLLFLVNSHTLCTHSTTLLVISHYAVLGTNQKTL